MDVNAYVKRIKPGIYGFSGYLDIKQDLYDKDLSIDLSLYRVEMNMNVLTPFQLRRANISTFMNVGYKYFYKETMNKCSTNMYQFEGDFVEPLDARKMEAHNCLIEASAFPDELPFGNYKFILETFGIVKAKSVSSIKIFKRA